METFQAQEQEYCKKFKILASNSTNPTNFTVNQMNYKFSLAKLISKLY